MRIGIRWHGMVLDLGCVSRKGRRLKKGDKE